MANKEKLERICFKIIEVGVYLVLLTPLIFLRDYFFLFIVPKTVFFGIVVNVIFAAYVLLAVSNPKYRPRFTPLTWAIIVFLVVLILTSVAGLNFGRSFFGFFERMTGLLTFFHLFAFYIVLTCCFKEKKYWERILTASIIVCVFVSLSVLFVGGPLTRGGGTLGNSSFFSAYLLFNLFFAVIFVVMKTGVRRLFYGLALMLFLYSLLINPEGFTKGAFAAFAAGAVVLFFGYLFYSGSRRVKEIAFLLATLLVLGLVGVLQIDFAREKAAEFWQSGSVQSRVVVWQMSWQAWQERFWLGWGLENFTVPFARHFDPKLASVTDVWFDRAHNIVLDIGVASGIFGLLSYLFIFGIAFFGLLKLLLKAADRESAVISFTPLESPTLWGGDEYKSSSFLTGFTMVALLAAYFFQNLWVFDTISSYMMFFLSLAFVNFLIYPQTVEAGKKTGFLAIFAGVVLIILTILAFYFGNIRQARASKLIAAGIARPLEQSIPAFQKAFEIFPLSRIEASEHLSMKMHNLADEEDRNEELLNQGFKLVEEQLKKAVLENPLDCRFYLLLGEHYNYFYEFDGDEEKLILAEETLKKAHELSPKLQKIYFALSQTRFLQKDKEKAIELLQRAKELEQQYARSIWELIKGYMKTREYELALLELKGLEELELRCRDAEDSVEVREIFKAAGRDIDVFIPLYEKGIEIRPQQLCFWQELVNVYLEKGETEKVKETLEGFLEARPDFSPEVEELLKHLED